MMPLLQTLLTRDNAWVLNSIYFVAYDQKKISIGEKQLKHLVVDSTEIAAFLKL